MRSRKQIETLYRQSHQSVVNRARMLLGDQVEANDVAQEVFAALLEAPDAFRGQASPLTYLFSLTTKLAITRLRKKAVRHEAWEKALSAMWTYAIPPSDPSLSAEVRQLVLRALESADEVTTQIVLGYCLDGMSQGEIAEVVGLSRVTVNQRLQAFRSQLSELSR
jgi:RNA polymerase sigma-70 factor, ECF subfamily